ncbi:late lactation protein B-like [Sminthopsis crassicaudata]|uniref:late lactation protein B-like n=1 Tax=Sminthopsis crassicaudata TaxID=9301 RepID=UPI003D69E643
MKVLFLTIALSLFAILHAEESNSSGKLGGVYYLNAVVASKEVPGDDHETFPPVTFSQLDNGNLEAKFTMMKDGECNEIKVIMKKTENANEYNIQGNYQHLHKVHVTETSVPDNWIFECEGKFQGEHFKLIKLLGPNKEADPQAMEEYLKITRQRNYDESKIIFSKPGESCVPKHD